MAARVDALLATAAVAAGLFAGAANATTLHGFCSTAAPCTDNGSNTPTSVNPPMFGFSAGGHSDTGTVMIDILVPDNVTAPAPYTISGPFLGTSTFAASLFSSTPWTSGDLDAYLGVSASPNDPIGAYLDTAEHTLQPAATGFYVYDASIGSVTLPSNSGATDADLMTTDRALVVGSYVVAFINDGGRTLGTNANSGAILEAGGTTRGLVPEPATWAMMLAGFGMAGVMLRRRARLAA